MKRFLTIMLLLPVLLILPEPASADDRPVLTIGDVSDRSGSRIDGEDQLGM